MTNELDIMIMEVRVYAKVEVCMRIIYKCIGGKLTYYLLYIL